jgi:hypothetical protein
MSYECLDTRKCCHARLCEKGSWLKARSLVADYWKFQLFLASRIGSYAYSFVRIVCAKVKMSLISSVDSESCQHEKPIRPQNQPASEPNVRANLTAKAICDSERYWY